MLSIKLAAENFTLGCHFVKDQVTINLMKFTFLAN